MSSEPPLPPRLSEILATIEDRDLSARLEVVFNSAASAIHQLGDTNLLSYQAPVDDDSPDLSLWEEMAPVIRDTVIAVNALLNSIGKASEQALADASQELSEEITRLGETMRVPQVVSDRWRLLAEVQSFRSKFRMRIGKMLMECASTLAEVKATEVIPGLAEEIEVTVQLRTAVTDLARVVNHRKRKISDAKSRDVETHFRQLRKDLDAFGRTGAYRALRAQDKRRVIEFRHRAAMMEEEGAFSREDVLALVDPFDVFVGSLVGVNKRETLVTHDRELKAALGETIDQVDKLLDDDLPQATRLFLEALNDVRGLYGRDHALDQFIRALRKRPFEGYDAAELRQGVEAFRELLANLSIG